MGRSKSAPPNKTTSKTANPASGRGSSKKPLRRLRVDDLTWDTPQGFYWALVCGAHPSWSMWEDTKKSGTYVQCEDWVDLEIHKSSYDELPSPKRIIKESELLGVLTKKDWYRNTEGDRKILRTDWERRFGTGAR